MLIVRQLVRHAPSYAESDPTPQGATPACRCVCLAVDAATVLFVAYVATVLRVMIASPSDIPDARDAVEAAVYGWNGANAQSKQIILQPWRWETNAVPALGGHPQALINAQSVDQSDIVFALFGSRLGSPTPDAVSGTVEEIERALNQGKPVHLYFSTAPLPNDVDTTQLDGLRAFRQEIQTRGLLGEFNNVSQLEHEVWKAIEYDIPKLDLGVSTLQRQQSGVDLLVQPQQEREITSYSKKGAPRYKTRRWVDITNRGTSDADDVVVESVGEQPSVMVFGEDTPTVIHAGQTRRVSILFTNGEAAPVIRIKWIEDGEPQEREFHVG